MMPDLRGEIRAGYNQTPRGEPTNLGRPRLDPSEKLRHYGLRLNNEDHKLFMVLGDGNFGEGVRRAANILRVKEKLDDVGSSGSERAE